MTAMTFPGLAWATPSTWAKSVVAHVPDLLLEQALLEKKAAAAATTFLFRVPSDPDAHRALSALAREELVHFERTLRLLQQRSLPLASQSPGPYAERLKSAVAADMPLRLCDELLVAAIIEARSCERMRLLADELQDTEPTLTAFYRDLVAAEERHHEVYLEIAVTIVPLSVVAERWQRLWQHEAAVLQSIPWLPRLHGGLPEASHGG